MAAPNTLIFVDFPSPDPAATAAFYAEVFGWTDEGRPEGLFHRLVPGGEYELPDGSPSGVGNLHLGIYSTADGRPNPVGYDSAEPARGRGVRVYVLVSDDDTQDRILDTAERLGATVLWRDHLWDEFHGFCGSFVDPWGSEVVLWGKAGDDPVLPEGFTRG